MTVQIFGLDRLIVDFRTMGPELALRSRQAVEVTSRNVKDQAVARIASAGYKKHYARSITYDIRAAGLLGWMGEIGPDKKRRQGALGNLLEFGSAKNPPYPHLGPALAACESDLVRGMLLAVRQATR